MTNISSLKIGDSVLYTFSETGKTIRAKVILCIETRLMLKSKKGIISIALNKMIPIIKKIS